MLANCNKGPMPESRFRAFAILERAMGQHQKQPSKQVVRQYMEGRQREHKPPPDPKQIRRELGWDLIEAQRTDQAGRR